MSPFNDPWNPGSISWLWCSSVPSSNPQLFWNRWVEFNETFTNYLSHDVVVRLSSVFVLIRKTFGVFWSKIWTLSLVTNRDHLNRNYFKPLNVDFDETFTNSLSNNAILHIILSFFHLNDMEISGVKHGICHWPTKGEPSSCPQLL